MNENTFEKRINTEIAAESGNNEALQEALSGAEKVSEVVGRNEGAYSTSLPTSQKKSSRSISQRIADLLFHRDPQKFTLPPVSIQRHEIQHSLEKEEKALLKKARKIESARHFSAAALEKVVRQIRYIQKILEELISMATEKLEQLYRQYVLKGA
ncbi:hypothetical protein K9M59_02230 [Candidatus Gracilibacteria bacterium]|nr:hypothetical protein [Candidatus Gracilibacteria bacterium]MCF7819660.1 hypothetical protein [Candidatus Gracilibacteria bacterium]